jgi:hypothetical protein
MPAPPHSLHFDRCRPCSHFRRILTCFNLACDLPWPWYSVSAVSTVSTVSAVLAVSASTALRCFFACICGEVNTSLRVVARNGRIKHQRTTRWISLCISPSSPVLPPTSSSWSLVALARLVCSTTREDRRSISDVKPYTYTYIYTYTPTTHIHA